MFKKYLPITISVFIVGLLVGALSMYIYIFSQLESNDDIPSNEIPTANENNEQNGLDLPTEGNLYVIDTNVDTSINVINEYDSSILNKDKNLLIMFASWCPNCQAELSEIEKILKHYKNNNNVNIVVIAHEFEDTVQDLINLIENNADFGDIQVKLDLKRVIRKHIDPEASTIPISYVVDKNGKILSVHNDSLTLEKAIEMLEK